jgi:2-polyprenyl-6-methoxyphenol hydroxylase-like FAD-dependent oxidoreductase
MQLGTAAERARRRAQIMTFSGHHAVVLGGSMGGLLAARALADHFERVTLVERDRFPNEVAQRKGVPQGRHAHALTASGCGVLERFFPGYYSELIARGAVECEMGEDARWYVAGVRLARVASGLRSLLASRPLIETHTRERLLALANVRALDDCDVLAVTGSAERVDGVRVRPRSGVREEQTLAANLVVDATGRGSRMPVWLAQLGLPAPEEERVRVDVGYTSCLYRHEPQHLQGDKAVVVAVQPPNRRCGVAARLEDGRWIVTLAGYLGEQAPASHEGLIEYARGLPSSDIYELLREAQPCSEPVTATYRESLRRRYEQLEYFPEGLIVFGDAICSFNPIYGQGMSVAALEAELLGECLGSRGVPGLWRRFFAHAAKVIDSPWSIAVGGDLAFEEVAGKRTFVGNALSAYVRKLQHAGATDERAALAFLRVAQLVAPPSSLLAPAVAARVLFSPTGPAHDRSQQAHPQGNQRAKRARRVSADGGLARP